MIGPGASAIPFAPGLQKVVDKCTVFQRTPISDVTGGAGRSRGAGAAGRGCASDYVDVSGRNITLWVRRGMMDP